jgi:hypothetical protein
MQVNTPKPTTAKALQHSLLMLVGYPAALLGSHDGPTRWALLT